MIFLYLIFGWFGIFFSYLLYLRIRESLRNGRPFYDFGKANFLFASALLIALVWATINLIGYEPEFESPESQIAYGQETNQPLISNEALWKIFAKDSHNIDDHFLLLRNHFSLLENATGNAEIIAYKEEEEKMFTMYHDLSTSSDSRLHDIGHVMLADMYISSPFPDYAEASDHLRIVDDPTTKYVNWNAARIMLYGAGSNLAEEHLYSEIRNKGYKKGAYEELAILYQAEHRDSSLRSIVYSGAENYIAPEIRARVYFLDHDLSRFYAVKFQQLFGGITFWGIAGGAAILFVWLYLLLSLGAVSGIGLKHLLLPLVAGGVTSLISFWLYAQYRYGFGFTLNGNLTNDFLFSLGGIGFIEELVKLIPFLCILWFTNMIRKPIDYILIASACGLGFAVLENLMYISELGLDVIHSRALTSSVTHMACSGIAAYGFVLCKYRWKNQFWLIPLFFILAVGAHGFYDFWLLNDSVKAFVLITLFFFLSLIIAYFSFINNALNQSIDEGDVQGMSRFDSLRTTSVFAGAMLLLFTFELVATCAVYGTHYANAGIVKSFLSGGYLVFFLSIRLSRIQIEPQRWKKIDVLSGLMPSQVFRERNDDEESTPSTSSPDEQTSPPESQ